MAQRRLQAHPPPAAQATAADGRRWTPARSAIALTDVRADPTLVWRSTAASTIRSRARRTFRARAPSAVVVSEVIAQAEMQALDLRAIELMEITSAIDPTRRVRVAFPMSSATGAAASASVYFEVAPGEDVGVHTDSSEEFLDIVEGRGEGLVGEETAPVETGPQVFVIGAPMPVMLPSTEAIPA